MGWGIALGILVLLGCIPLGAEVSYTEKGPAVRIAAAFLRIPLFPRKKKQKQTKPKPDKTAEPKKPAEKPKPEKKGGSLKDFLPFIRDGMDFLGDFRRKLRVNKLNLTIIMGGADPADLAVGYGRTCAAVAGLQPQLNRILVIKKQKIRVDCDFTQEISTALLEMTVTITLGRLIGLLGKYGWRVGKHLLELKKVKKTDSNEKDGN